MVSELDKLGIKWREFNIAECSVEHFSDVTHVTPVATYGEPGGLKLIGYLRDTGVSMLNTSKACRLSDDKILTAEALECAGVVQPRWCVVKRDNLDLDLSVGYPAVLKRPEGALGVWNRLVETPEQIIASVEELLSEGGENLLAQEAIMESLGTSIRVVVLDGDVLAATELRAQQGEWRSNGALGGVGYDCKLGETEKKLAAEACRALGLRYAGVDLIRSDKGCLVLEVNSGSPFDGAERRTGKNIARALIEALLVSE
jgi:ribosomal protein S6--L-glutamate ligase